MLYALLAFRKVSCACGVGNSRPLGSGINLGDMAMLKRIMRVVVAAGLMLGTVAALSAPAEAGRGGRVAAGVAVGTLLGLGIAGAYAGPRYYYGPGPECYRGPRQCDWVGRSCWYNRFGEYVCRGGEYRCWRPTICD
jgi:hypothetical protein